jgi:acetolactate synthase-1/2/3 large subunit
VGELAVAVRLNLKVVFVVLSDNDLALIRIKQEKKANAIYGTEVREKGAIGTTNLFGVPVLSTATPGEFREALLRGFAGDGPIVVEAIVDSREYDSLVLKKDKF